MAAARRGRDRGARAAPGSQSDEDRARPGEHDRGNVRGSCRRRRARSARSPPLGATPSRVSSRALRGAPAPRSRPPPGCPGAAGRRGRDGDTSLAPALRRLPGSDRQRARRCRARARARRSGGVPPAAARPARRRGGRRGARLVAGSRALLPQLRLGAAARGRHAATVGDRPARRGGRSRPGRPPVALDLVGADAAGRGAARGRARRDRCGATAAARRRRGGCAPDRVRRPRGGRATPRPGRRSPQAHLERRNRRSPPPPDGDGERGRRLRRRRRRLAGREPRRCGAPRPSPVPRRRPSSRRASSRRSASCSGSPSPWAPRSSSSSPSRSSRAAPAALRPRRPRGRRRRSSRRSASLASGAVDADELAEGGSAPLVLLLLPGLVGFAAAIGAARLLPVVGRLLARRGRASVRLAGVSLARAPGAAGIAAAFLALAIGLAALAESYRSTLARGERDRAAFALPTDVVVRENLRALVPVFRAAPLERFERLPGVEAAHPIVRATASAGPAASISGVTVLGASPEAVESMPLWREDWGSIERRSPRRSRPAARQRSGGPSSGGDLAARRRPGSRLVPRHDRATGRLVPDARPRRRRRRGGPSSSRRVFPRPRAAGSSSRSRSVPPRLGDRGADSGVALRGRTSLRVLGVALDDWVGQGGVTIARDADPGALDARPTPSRTSGRRASGRGSRPTAKPPAAVVTTRLGELAGGVGGTLAAPGRRRAGHGRGRRRRRAHPGRVRRRGARRPRDASHRGLERGSRPRAGVRALARRRTGRGGPGRGGARAPAVRRARDELAGAARRRTRAAIRSRTARCWRSAPQRSSRSSSRSQDSCSPSAPTCATTAGELADLEAQGATPGLLRRTIAARGGRSSARSGVAGGVVAGLVLAVLVTRVVAVTARADAPEPPLVTTVDPLLLVRRRASRSLPSRPRSSCADDEAAFADPAGPGPDRRRGVTAIVELARRLRRPSLRGRRRRRPAGSDALGGARRALRRPRAERRRQVDARARRRGSRAAFRRSRRGRRARPRRRLAVGRRASSRPRRRVCRPALLALARGRPDGRGARRRYRSDCAGAAGGAAAAALARLLERVGLARPGRRAARRALRRRAAADRALRRARARAGAARRGRADGRARRGVGARAVLDLLARARARRGHGRARRQPRSRLRRRSPTGSSTSATGGSGRSGSRRRTRS